MNRPKLRDVATMAGVDIATVSRALNKSRGVEALSAACIRRVEAAARKLGYRPNSHARSMRTGKANAIGVVAPVNRAYWFMLPLTAGVHAAALGHGCHCVTIGHEAGETALETARRFYAEGRIDGLILPYWSGKLEELRAVEKSGCPTVMIGASQGSRLPSVSVDDIAGMRMAVERLAQMGHRRILYVGYRQPEDAFRIGRRLAVQRRAEELGLECSAWGLATPSVPIDVELEANRRELLRRMTNPLPATAAICYNDSIALALYAALQERGLRVPGDLSVIGFDDVFARLAYPPLTSVSHMFESLGNAAVDLLLAPASDDSKPQRILVEPILVMRQSVRKLEDSTASTEAPGIRQL